jgi:ABC-type microcin C transport system permease subunit YejB
MFKYILKRVFIFIPTLLVISLLTFMLSVSVPGDPVEQMLSSSSETGGRSTQASEQAYIDKRHNLGLDLPIFYFAISNEATPADLHDIPKKFHRENLSRLISKYGNWNEIKTYYGSLKNLENKVSGVEKDSVNGDALIAIKDNLYKLYVNYDEQTIASAQKNIRKSIAAFSTFNSLKSPFRKVTESYQAMQTHETAWKNYIPAINGSPNSLKAILAFPTRINVP